MKICDGIYAYIWRGVFENNCNMYYFADPLNILFDPGLSHHLDTRYEEMSKDGIELEDIQYVVNTHAHPDHFEGSAHFIDKGIPAAMHKDDIDYIKDVGPTFFSMMGLQFPSINFNLVLEEGEWKIGDTNLEIFHTPGHSPGSISIYWPEKKALVCGDLIFISSVGRIDFPGGNGMLLKKSIKRISELNIEILLPGHMDYINGKEAVIKNFDIINNSFTLL